MTCQRNSLLGLSIPVILFSASMAQAQAQIEAPRPVTISTEDAAPAENAEAAEAVNQAAAAAADAADAATGTQASILHCGAVSATWINATQDQSDLLAADQAWQFNQTASPAQGFAFHLSRDAAVRLEAVARNNGDPSLRLLDSQGDTLQASDDTNDSLNAQILTELPAGDYCLWSEDLRSTPNLTVLAGLNAHASLFTSSELECGPQTEAIALGGDDLASALAKASLSQSVDSTKLNYLRFHVTSPVSMSLRASAGGEIDPLMVLFDASGTEIAQNDDADGRNARLDFLQGLPSGTYCIGVKSPRQIEGQIMVSAQVIDPAEYKQRAYERGELVPFDGSYPVTELKFNQKNGEVVLQGAAVNWLRFELQERSVIAVHTLGTISGADTMLTLFDSTGESLVQVDDTENSRNAVISPMSLEPGEYYVALSDRASSGQLGAPLRMVVVLAERYTRASAE